MVAFYKTYGDRVVVDSAFSRSMYPFLLKSAIDETDSEKRMDVITLRQLTLVCKASKWGMRAFYGSFL